MLFIVYCKSLVQSNQNNMYIPITHIYIIDYILCYSHLAITHNYKCINTNTPGNLYIYILVYINQLINEHCVHDENIRVKQVFRESKYQRY